METLGHLIRNSKRPLHPPKACAARPAKPKARWGDCKTKPVIV